MTPGGIPRPDAPPLQRLQEGDQVPLLLRLQLELEHDVEELHRVLEGEQAPVVEVGRRVLDAPQGEGLDGAVLIHHRAVGHARLEEALELEVVHGVVGVVGRGVAGEALAATEEDLLTTQLLLGGEARIQLAVDDAQLGGGREVQDGLELGHVVHLAANRKSTRLNSSHVKISYAVFCLKKKKKRKMKSLPGRRKVTKNHCPGSSRPPK